MSVQDIEEAVTALPEIDREQFAVWYTEFCRREEAEADAWDEQIARDAAAGRLDRLLALAEEQVAAGQFSKIVPR